MSDGPKTIVFPVSHPHLGGSTALFRTLLGVDPYIEEEYYVGFRPGGTRGGVEIGLDPDGHSKGLTGPVPYWKVEDIEAALQQLAGSGADRFQEARDVGGGRRIASVQDADGNVIGLMQDTA